MSSCSTLFYGQHAPHSAIANSDYRWVYVTLALAIEGHAKSLFLVAASI